MCYDVDGNPKWERRLPLPENPYGASASPILAGELLVFNHQGKEAYLLGVNRRDGRPVWRTDRSLFRYGWSTPVHWRHDGSTRIYIASAEGVVTVIDAGVKLNVLATNKLDGAILATPALAAGNIYVRTESHLYAFGK